MWLASPYQIRKEKNILNNKYIEFQFLHFLPFFVAVLDFTDTKKDGFWLSMETIN